MAKTTTWQQQIAELPDKEFPITNSSGRVLFEDRQSMTAAFEWFVDNGTGPVVERLANGEPIARAFVPVWVQHKHHREEQERAAHARERKLAPLAAARERREKERLALREQTIARLSEDLRETHDRLQAALKPGFGKIDWQAARSDIGHLASIATRLRFQANSAENAAAREAARKAIEEAQ